MHAILCSIADERYAVPAHHLVEVVPAVAPRPLAHAMPWVLGLMNYRGDLLPLIDAAALLGRPPRPRSMLNRVLVLRLKAEDENRQAVGLLVGQILGVDEVDFDDPSAYPGLRIPEAEYLGPVACTEAGTVQLLDPTKLLTAEQRAVLFDRGSGSA